MNTSRCAQTGCGMEIIWTTSPAGAKLPVDARPVTAYLIDDFDPPNATAVRTATGAGGGEQKLHVSHWLTCKNPPKR